MRFGDMSSSPKKISNRRKKGNANYGIHSVPGEIVEIERNIIENWLISIKQWFKVNPSTARKIVFGVFLLFILIFFLVFLHGEVVEKQNSQYYSSLFKYEKLKKESAGKPVDEDKMKDLLKDSTKLCRALWATQYSNAGCLLSAVYANELKDSKQTAEFLEKFAKKASSNAISAFATFYAGYYSETNQDLAEAEKLYDKLESMLPKKADKDFVLYHKGRILYYESKLDKAERIFKDIMENYKSSPYRDNARKYLLLVEMKKSEKK